MGYWWVSTPFVRPASTSSLTSGDCGGHSARRLLVSSTDLHFSACQSTMVDLGVRMVERTAMLGTVSRPPRSDRRNAKADWSDFPHDHARSRTFRWGEDGIAGVSDSHGQQNIAFAFWNEKEYDPAERSRSSETAVLTVPSDFLKERLFGLSNPEGNHGESLKEAHFHLDNTPTV